nr:immunoglobulin light chain junction region [Macaca mulatta]
CLQGYITPLTV